MENSESQFVRRFELVQDTPMWVFNPNEPGCGLRATEVKPKLDRYLREKCGITKKDYEDWFIKGTDALDYKMRIEYPNQNQNSNSRQQTILNKKNKEKYPLFFGNIGSNGSEKSLMMFDNITMTIFSRHTGLLGTIDKHLALFFACHSFGTRQSKGFGCFRCIPENQERQNEIVIPQGNCFSFEVNGFQPDNLFLHIYYFHKVIRSGVNENGNYIKSLMYHYAKSKSSKWDKPVIRRKFEYYNPVYKYIATGIIELPKGYKKYKSAKAIKEYYKNRSKKYRSDDPSELNLEYNEEAANSLIMYRDCLGLASEQAWQSYDYSKEYKEKIMITSESKTVTRFCSPIKYHPVKFQSGYTVFIILEEINPDYRNVTFSIENAISENAVEDKNTTLRGQIPTKEQFDLVDYFNYIAKNKDKATNMQKNSSPYKYINTALSTLKEINNGNTNK